MKRTVDVEVLGTHVVHLHQHQDGPTFNLEWWRDFAFDMRKPISQLNPGEWELRVVASRKGVVPEGFAPSEVGCMGGPSNIVQLAEKQRSELYLIAEAIRDCSVMSGATLDELRRWADALDRLVAR